MRKAIAVFVLCAAGLQAGAIRFTAKESSKAVVAVSKVSVKGSKKTVKTSGKAVAWLARAIW